MAAPRWSTAAGAELWWRELWSDFFALLPVVVGVALEAAGFGVIGTGGVAGLAGGDAWEQDVA